MLKLLFPFAWLRPGRFDLARDGLGACGCATWGLVVAGVGTGVSMIGANKQAKDAAHAQDQNLAAQAESERQNWLRYLMTRGVNPGADVRTGQVPGYAPGAVMNTKLPLWMRVIPPVAPPPAQGPIAADGTKIPFLIKKG